MITIYDGGLFWTMPLSSNTSLYLGWTGRGSLIICGIPAVSNNAGQVRPGVGLMELKLTSIATIPLDVLLSGTLNVLTIEKQPRMALPFLRPSLPLF